MAEGPVSIAALLVGAVVLVPGTSGGQSSAPAVAASVRVERTAESPRLDGVPDEAVWGTADSITDFTQSDPAEGHPATERTVVRLLATDRGLYVGLWAYDSAPGTIRRAQLRRDAELDSDDSFTILLDPLRDHRSGYLFGVNPNGALYDAEVLSFERTNVDWNGVWDARARITASGWTAEMLIPWQTLRYDPDAERWGANFRRLIRRKNEEVLWRAWTRTEGLLFLEREGTLGGLGGLPGRGIAELKPYVATTGELAARSFRPDGTDSLIAAARIEGSGGLDAKIAVASALTLDVTVKTDFAQVEADRQVVNLTRFPLFFPEQRPFFLEASGTFDFGDRRRTFLFYSRRIGLAPDGSPIPLLAGARLTGRLSRNQVGLLAVRTGDPEDAVDLVARVKHDVLARGYVGGMVMSQSGPGVPAGESRLAGGADLDLPFVIRGQNLVLAAFAAAVRNSSSGPAATGWRVFLDYPNDFIDNFLSVGRFEPGFDPALGFVTETGVVRYSGSFRVFPRPHRWAIRKLIFNVIQADVATHLDGALSHAFYQVIPFGAELESGDVFQFKLQRREDVPASAFEIFRGDTIAPGRYRWNRAELEFSSSAGRPVGLSLKASAGDYYTGSGTEVEATLTVRAAPYVITIVEVAQQDVSLATGHFTARAARLRLDVAASPRLGTTLFLQRDNESERVTANARLHWIPSPGSDAYLVWNSAWPTGLDGGIPWRQPLRGALVGKLVYYFRL